MSLRFKTVIGIALIEAILLALLIVTVMSYQRNSAEEALQKRAYTTAELFSTTTKDPLLSMDLASLDAFSSELMKNPDLLYVRVIAQDGQVYSEAGTSELLKREFAEDRNLEDVGDGIFDVSASIKEGGIEYGRVELGFDTGSIQQLIAEARNYGIGIAMVEMGLVALFSLLLGTYLTRQLEVLRHSAKKISKGDYTVKIPTSGKDEISELATAFNSMSVALLDTQKTRDKHEADLKELNQTLEQRVELRTEKINRQIEELKLANSRIADTQAKLIQSEKLASIGQLAAGVAHEINNPIGFVRSNLSALDDYINVYQILIENYRSIESLEADAQEVRRLEIASIEKSEDIDFINQDIRELLADCRDGTTRVRDIVAGLKDFSHQGSKSRDLCDLNACITSTLKIATNGLKHKCDVLTDLQDIPLIRANQGELNQILMNLFVNAGQAISHGGSIGVRTTSNGSTVSVAVSDTGSGIEPENLDKLFDPFFTTKPIGEGTGLGLAISYGIIQDHDGSIDVESEVGVGTTFTINFPLPEEGKSELPLAA
ncbi:hypothetical protein AB833_13310 [Chromatiales bacterium (ex Bugula neritina AB1)]|nr:hypothetical protein AB833_13310 [Chromatiales bacterium (ex Bugula neritina AB1)]